LPIQFAGLHERRTKERENEALLSGMLGSKVRARKTPGEILLSDWLNLLKTNAAIRGWLTVSATDVKVPMEERQAICSSYYNGLGKRWSKAYLVDTFLPAKIL